MVLLALTNVETFQIEQALYSDLQCMILSFSETVIIVDDVEKITHNPMNEQQIVERFFEIGSKRREILASRCKTPKPGRLNVDRRRLSVDYVAPGTSSGLNRPFSRDSSVDSSWNGSNSSLHSESE